MIDTHLHVVPPQLPGVGALSPLLRERPEVVIAALVREMRSAEVHAALAMGCWHPADSREVERDPLGVAATLAIAREVPGLHAVGVADPTRGTDPAHLRRVEAALLGGQVRALKAYLG